MQEKIKEVINGIITGSGLPSVDFIVEHPVDLANGDYSSNVAMVLGKKLARNPVEIANEMVNGLNESFEFEVGKVEVAGPGFINFHLSNKFFEETVHDVINQGKNYGRNNRLNSQKTIIEFTDPNPFKVLHIGHMMSNFIGEALCKISEWNGAEVKRAIYQGDIGLHVAKAVWGMIQNRAGFPHDEDSLEIKIRFLSNAYSFGSHEYESDNQAKKEIDVTNKMLFDRSNHELNIYYEKGRKWSMEAFEIIYKRLGTKFDFYFLESDTGVFGKEVVEKNISTGIFEVSEGAVVYKAEKHGLHTRVFINSQGLPTYEAKELGLAKTKAEKYGYDRSIVITANEQDHYFKVILKALEEVFPDLAAKTTHMSHGMLRLPTGKMSSRTGDVISAESLIDDTRGKVLEKIEGREYEEGVKEQVLERVALASIKYSILKQAIGKDIIFDFDKSLSFEGDSGPYLQYTTVRASSLLKKAETEGLGLVGGVQPENWEIKNVEKILNRFPEVVAEAYDELAPQKLVTYLTELASEFNTFYNSEQIIEKENIGTSYKVGITQAVFNILENGLGILGIELPERM
ncbi:MAG: arginine--tRNA ligase [Candidatus Pacebacteria bacterium]|nr:arginine--tRNA ligase [Candidatus Paceibacterota bacterium]